MSPRVPVLLVVLCLGGAGCGGRAPVMVGREAGAPSAGQPSGPVESADTDGAWAPTPAEELGLAQCRGENRAIYFGDLVEFTEVIAYQRPQDYDIEGDFITVRFAQEIGPPTRYTSSTSWSGIFVTFRSATRLRSEDFPLVLGLHALPTGWEIGVSRYAGYCRGPEGPCMSNASPAQSTLTPSFEGSLVVTAGPGQTMTLCLTALGDEHAEELFVWVGGLELDEEA